MATRKKTKTAQTTDALVGDVVDAVQSVKHRTKRMTTPQAGPEAQCRVEEAPRVRHEYNLHPSSEKLRSSGRAALQLEHEAAARWVGAVNRWGHLGRWDFLACRDPQQLLAMLQQRFARP